MTELQAVRTDDGFGWRQPTSEEVEAHKKEERLAARRANLKLARAAKRRKKNDG